MTTLGLIINNFNGTGKKKLHLLGSNDLINTLFKYVLAKQI